MTLTYEEFKDFQARILELADDGVDLLVSDVYAETEHDLLYSALGYFEGRHFKGDLAREKRRAQYEELKKEFA